MKVYSFYKNHQDFSSLVTALALYYVNEEVSNKTVIVGFKS